MKKKFFLFVSLVLLAVQGWATEVNPTSLQFSTDVGQTATQTIRIEFDDAEQSDPNTPVVMSPSYGNPLQSIGQVSGDYSVSILGTDSQMFSSEITLQSFTSNACNVKVSYNPTAEGTHQATLKVHCNSAGVVSPVSVNLTGVATTTSDDPFTHLGSVTNGNGTGLPDGFVLPDYNSDDYEKADIRFGPLAILAIITFIKEFAPSIDIVEVDENETFNNVTVGTTATKTYEVRGDNVFNDLVKLINRYHVNVKIKLTLSETDYTPILPYDALISKSEMFSVNPSSIRPYDIDGGRSKNITITYKPTSAGVHWFKIIPFYEFTDFLDLTYYDLNPLKPLLPILNYCGLEYGTAVERHFTATANGPLTFNDVTIGDKRTCSIHVEGSNLNGPLTVDLSPKNGMFSIDKESITADDAANGADITVTYEPTAAGSHAANIKISGGGTSETTEFDFTGNCQLPPPPSITVDQTPLNFGIVTLGDDNPTKRIVVTGTNLTSDINLSISGASGSMFTALPYRISPADAAAGRPVVVTYKPTDVGNHTATLVITGGGADPVEISLTGKCLPSLEPSIEITPSTYDFGTVNAETTHTAIFTVTGTNLSERISLFWPQEDGYTISPTDLPATGGKVTVTFKPNYEGNCNQEFTFSSSGISTKLYVTGKCVIPPTIKTNVSTLDFGTVVKGNQLKKTLKVTGVNLTGNLTLSSNSSHFTVSPTTITAADAAAGKTVTVIYKPSSGGNHNATLTIKGGGAESKTVSLTGKCAAIDVSPSTYDFGTVKAGTTNTKSFTVTGTNLSERISLIWLQEDGFSITPTDLPATGGTVTVTFKPSSARSYSQEFNLSSSGVSNKITVTGKCATITTSKSSIDFGSVVKSKKKTESFTVKGYYLTGDLTLSSSSSYFKVSPDRITASEAAVGKTVTVTYEPTVKGTHTATITISGGSAAPKTVSVSGKCVVPTISTNKSSLVFGSYYETQTIKVTGTDLTGNLTLTTNNSIFAVSPSTITVAEAKTGKTVLVLCDAPLNTQHASGKITISGGDAIPQTVSLTFNANGNVPAQIGLVEPENESDGENDGFINGELLGANGNNTAIVSELEMNSKIYADRLNIIIESPVEQNAIVSDIAGHLREVNLQAGRNEIPVNASGIYIVRIREKSTKLMLK